MSYKMVIKIKLLQLVSSCSLGGGKLHDNQHVCKRVDGNGNHNAKFVYNCDDKVSACVGNIINNRKKHVTTHATSF